MTHIMLDLETWGRTPGSDIRSIGAVVFDPIAGWMPTHSEAFIFYVACDNPIEESIAGVLPVVLFDSLRGTNERQAMGE